MKKLIQRLLFLNFDIDLLNAAKTEILDDNRRCLILYSAIVSGGMAILLFLSVFVDVLLSSRNAYVVAIVLSVAIFAVAIGPAKKHQELTVICEMLLIIFLLGFGIILGTVVEPNQASTSYSILIFVAPLLFTNLPYRINIITIISIIVYIFAAKATQSGEMFAFNMSVILPYGLTNLVLTHFTCKMKIERHIYAHQKKEMAEYDRMTGLLNRWSFERDVDAAEVGEIREIAVCSFDVNNLKPINDSYGHKAGDELLIASSEAIKNIFGPYGKCYRIGGDEFMAVLYGEYPEPEKLIEALNEQTAVYRSSYGFVVSVSTGIVKGESTDIDTLIAQADKLMYQNKNSYYLATGNIQRIKV